MKKHKYNHYDLCIWPINKYFYFIITFSRKYSYAAYILKKVGEAYGFQ